MDSFLEIIYWATEQDQLGVARIKLTKVKFDVTQEVPAIFLKGETSFKTDCKTLSEQKIFFWNLKNFFCKYSSWNNTSVPK